MSTINGTVFADSLYGTAGADSIFGFAGDDTIKGGGGADRIDGGTGIDTVFYTDSTVGVTVNLATGHGVGGTADGDSYVSVENVWGSTSNDTLIGDDGANRLTGLDGNDTLKGGGGADTLDGGSGNDTLKGGGGADHFIGGAGIDTVDYSGAGPSYGILGVYVDLSTGATAYGDAAGDTFDGIENLTGSAYGDFLYGNDVANVLSGGDSSDDLLGYGGNDTLIGGNGDDLLDGGTGNDTMTGGTGNDYYYVDSTGDVVNEFAGQGAYDVVATKVSLTLAPGQEIENTFADTYTTAIDLTGNEFSQRLAGNEGTNTLQGLGGNDNLYGGGGFDRLFGGDGNDVLIGAEGPDDLIGGAGGDLFTYYFVAEIGGITPGTFDVIHDFNRAEGDGIDVSWMDSNANEDDGRQSWTFVGATTSFTAPGQIGYSSDGVDTFILFNTDNDAINEATIRVGGVHTVDASWFLL